MDQQLKSEKAVIGSMLLDPSCIDLVKKYIRDSSYFKNFILGEAFSTIIKMHEEKKNIDLITVSDTIGINKAVVLADALNETVTSAHAEEYARIIRDYYVRKVLAEKLKSINPFDEKKYLTPLDVVTKIEKETKLVSALLEETEEVNLETLVGEVYDDFYKTGEEKQMKNLIPTGFIDLDKIILGLERGENIVIAGRPGMGKTALALNIALNVAKKGYNVLIFSLEMSARRLIARLLCMEGRIDTIRFKEKSLYEEEHERLAKAVAVVSNLPLKIIEKVNKTIDIRSIIAKHTAKKDIGLVIIDFLQLIKDQSIKGRTRANEVGDIAKAIQDMAHFYDVPIILISQLNRECEKRPDKRPKQIDLYESGDIEASADKILALYRDEEYNPDTKDKGIAEVGVLKHRDGSKGMVKLAWLGYCTKFENLVRSG
ncbi:MAG: AAA family ATPase [Candidatus Omnitrophica bacterium]|nr:AAA family ATPase [Candidatus Omnitrophota bacterium]